MVCQEFLFWAKNIQQKENAHGKFNENELLKLTDEEKDRDDHPQDVNPRKLHLLLWYSVVHIIKTST
jgi:hypothetical protein